MSGPKRTGILERNSMVRENAPSNARNVRDRPTCVENRTVYSIIFERVAIFKKIAKY